MKQTMLQDFEVQRYSKAVRAMKVADDELVSVDLIKDPLEVIVFTKNAEALRFRASDVSLYGTAASGVRSINLKPNDEVVSVIYCNKNDDFLLLTNRNTIKRMKVTDLLLSKRSRAGTQVIKKLKSNPYLVLKAIKMTPNQYKENVKVHVIYQNGNDDIDAFSLKYNVSDAGRTLSPDNLELKHPVSLAISAPSKEDDAVSADYLVEVRTDLFSENFGIEDEKPLGSSKTTVFDDLADILKNEQAKSLPKEEVVNPTIEEVKEEEPEPQKEIKYKKISLFDDEEDNNF